jgi:uncharacterized protein
VPQTVKPAMYIFVRMWQVLTDHFRRYPAQERVVRLMIQNGLRIHDGKVFAGEVEIADTAIGRAADVDRRIVRSTVETISRDPDLRRAFTRFAPTLHLKDVAPALGCGVLEIVANDAHQTGILAGVSQVISSAGISIRQAIVEDPEFSDEAVLFVVTERPVPGDLVPQLQRVPGVKSVTLRGLEPG